MEDFNLASCYTAAFDPCVGGDQRPEAAAVRPPAEQMDTAAGEFGEFPSRSGCQLLTSGRWAPTAGARPHATARRYAQ